jgi:aryl-alcohol dehydrogenase
MQIEAWVQRNPDGDPTLEALTLDEPRDDEVLVRIGAVGVCHTDLFAPKAFGLPAVFGHEGAGVVERVGSVVTKVKPGDRVVLTFASCGLCPACSGNAPAYCVDSEHLQFGGSRRDHTPTLHDARGPIRGAFFQQSSFASHALATERNVVPIPDDLAFDLAAPLGCGVQTGVGTVLNALRPRAGESLTVFGAGTVGLSAIMAASLAGCDPLVAVDLVPERLELAREFGATHVLDGHERRLVEKLLEITQGGARYTIETAGALDSFDAAIGATDRRGICALLTVPNLGKPIPFAPLPILMGRTLTGVVEGNSIPDEFIPRLIKLRRAGKLPYARLISRYGFEDLPRALADARAHRVIKPVLVAEL